MDDDSARRLESWLRESGIEGGREISVSAIGAGQGTANVMLGVRWGDRRLVLRHPPKRKVTQSAGSVEREARLLAALDQTDVRHAGFVGVCQDEEVIGVPFLLMEHVDGYVPSDPLPERYDDPAARHCIGLELVDALAELALVDWRAVGLDGFGKPDGFLTRQIDRWLWQLESYKVRELDALPAVADWLRTNLPPAGPVGIMHGDYSTFNVMFAADSDPRLIAIIDWDTATIGEVLMDLGHLLSRWDEPGEEPTTLGSSDIAVREGLSSRKELAERYHERTGFDVTGIRYYEVLSLFKLSCIMEGQYANHMNTRPDKPLGPFTNIGPGLMNDALRIARGEIH
jgi:aminoglycoside phosphotransferase (APT) family kinase protein